MKAEIICVGTELLLGDIVNTNAQFIARQLSALGISVYNQQVVGDNPKRLYQAAELAKTRSDIVIYTGGLGPTDDDLTKQTVARVYNDTLVFNQSVCDKIEEYFKKIGRPMTDNNKKQAYVPERGKYLENSYGTAPGIVFIDGEKLAVLMPGVPREMKPMMTNQVVPMLKKLVRGTIISRYVHVIGIGESALEEKISILLSGENPTMALYAKEGEVTVRLTAFARDDKTANEMLDKLYEKLDSLVHDNIYGVDVENIETVIVNKLKEQGKTVAVAESCTGGGISARITSVPGASSVFSLGVCTYSDGQKHKILGINREDLETYTAVSSVVACQMAQGVREKAGADYAIATTGYAGPGGGTPQEPVGTVYIAVAVKECTYVKKCSFAGERARITHLACQNAFDLLRCVMDGIITEGVRIVDNGEYDVEDEEKPKEKSGFLKAFTTAVMLILLSAVLAGGYLWYKNGGNEILHLPRINIDFAGITDKITGFFSKEPAEVSAVLADRQSLDFFSQGFEQSTLKTLSDLKAQNPDLRGWLTFKYSKKEYPVYGSENNLPDCGVYISKDGNIPGYKYIYGFAPGNFFSLTDLSAVRENTNFLLLGFDGGTDYRIFSVGTFSREEFESLTELKNKQEYIVAVRSRSLYDVDVAVRDSDDILALVQKSEGDRYTVAFAVPGSRGIFPSVDIKTMSVYSDWYMEENNLTNENAAQAILYAQEVYDRDNRVFAPPEIDASPSRTDSSFSQSSYSKISSSFAQSSREAQSSPSAQSSSKVRSSPNVQSSSKPARSPSAVRSSPRRQSPSAASSAAVIPSPSKEPSPPPDNTPEPAETPKPSAEPVPAEEILTVTMNGQVVSGPATEILSRIVAIEMSSGWNREALKAQAVATHTYLEYQYSNGVKAPAVSGRTSPSQNVVDAVSRVSDLVMTVNGKAVYTPYCASVAGKTNPASQVWGTAHSHLVSVESKYDYLSTGYEKVYNISAEEMKEILDGRIGTNLDLENAENWFETVDCTDGGYVRRMSVDGVKTYKAANGNTRNITGWYFATDILRDAGRPLRSAAFTISYSDGMFTIVTQGYGHGVGLSQWGAQLYAVNEGWTYDKILTHYYTGVSIQKWK